MADNAEIERTVEQCLAAALPDVDLLEVVAAGRGTLRLTIDHPAGVDHELCAQVTHALDGTGIRERFGIQVWSPGPERPLRTPGHFASAAGRRVRLRIADAPDGPSRTLSGRVVAADDRAVRLAAREGEIDVPLAGIRRARLMKEEESA